MGTYVNNLRLLEITTGDESGTWGTKTNTNLELIADAFGSGTEAITTNADAHTTTIADGAADEGRAIFLKYTGTLDSACTITIAPNTVNKVWLIENATSGSQNIIISQGSGANITIGNGNIAAVLTDGAGSGAAVLDAFADLELSTTLTVAGAITGASTVQGTTITATTAFVPDASDGAALGTTSLEFSDLYLADGAVIGFGDDQEVTLTHVHNTGLLLSSTDELQFGDAASRIFQSADGVLRIDGEVTLDLYGSTSVNVSNDLLLNSDASVLGFGVNNDVTLTHVHDTGLLLNSTMALQFNDASQYINAPSNAILDITATDEIELNATAIDLNGTLDVSGTITVAGNADLNGDLDVDGTTNLDVVDIDGAVDMATTALVTGVLTTTATQVANGGITSGDDISVGATDKIFLDGGSNTYITESAADVISIYTENMETYVLGGSGNPYVRIQAGAGGGTATTQYYEGGEFFWQHGVRGADEKWYLTGNATLHSSYALMVSGQDVTVGGALAKGSGSFKIDHPLPSMKDTHHLVHSFIEGPRADLIYRGSVALSGGSASVDLDEEVGMTDGTWELLCRDPQVFLQNESGWSALKGSVSGSTLLINCENTNSIDTVSWMVVAERQDEHMMDTNWTDSNGRPIIEPEKPEDVEDGS